MQKYQNVKIFLKKDYVPDWFEEVFVIKKVKNTASWTYVISDLNRKEIFGTIYKKEFAKNKSKSV